MELLLEFADNRDAFKEKNPLMHKLFSELDPNIRHIVTEVADRHSENELKNLDRESNNRLSIISDEVDIIARREDMEKMDKEFIAKGLLKIDLKLSKSKMYSHHLKMMSIIHVFIEYGYFKHMVKGRHVKQSQILSYCREKYNFGYENEFYILKKKSKDKDPKKLALDNFPLFNKLQEEYNQNHRF